MKSRLFTSGVALVLCVVMFLTACSTSWISQAEAIVNVLAPAAVNIIELVALLQGKTVSQADVDLVARAANQANADFALVQTLLQQYSDVNATTTIQKIDAALADAQQNLGGILTAVHVSDPATVQKVQAVVRIVIAEIQSLESIIPAIQGKQAKRAVKPMSAKSFKPAFNQVMRAPTGSAAVDAATAGLELK